jgi:hypothetical protein
MMGPQIRADATESAGSGVNLTTQSYSAKVWALHQDIGDQVRQNADPAVEVDVVATRQLMQKMLIRRDRYFVTTYLQPSIWGTTITGVASSPSTNQTIQWSDDANGDPFTDIATGQTVVLQNTGFLPNILLITWPVYQALRKHPLVIDRIKYTGTANKPATLTPGARIPVGPNLLRAQPAPSKALPPARALPRPGGLPIVAYAAVITTPS